MKPLGLILAHLWLAICLYGQQTHHQETRPIPLDRDHANLERVEADRGPEGAQHLPANKSSSSTRSKSQTLNSDGVQTAWVRHYGSDRVASTDRASSLALDAVGNVYVSGASGSDIVTIKYNADGDTLWLRRYNGPGAGNDRAPTLVVDRLGNVYVTGGSDGYFGDFLTMKYDMDGGLLWTRTYNGPIDAGDYATGIAVDDELNVYVVGYRRVMSGQWQTQEPYVIKYDQQGNVLWQRVTPQLSGSISIAQDICIEFTPDDDIITAEFTNISRLSRETGKEVWTNDWTQTGGGIPYTRRLAVDHLGGVYVSAMQGFGEQDGQYLAAKFSPDGILVWQKYLTGPSAAFDATSDIEVDRSGNIYVTGSSGGRFVTAKLAPNGNPHWVRSYSSPGEVGGRGCAIALDKGGNVYVTGSDQDDYATIKYDSAGNTVWVKRYNGPGSSTDDVASMHLAANGMVYVTGGSLGAGTDFDFATIKYDMDGNTLWTRRYDGIAHSYDRCASLALDSAGNAYLTGSSGSTASGNDFTTVKFSVTGDMEWATHLDGLFGRADEATSIGVDVNRNVYVTGRSEDSDTSAGYLTLKYNSDGSMLWEQRYRSPSGGGVGAVSLAVGGGEYLYVTGSSDDANITLKYAADGSPVWMGRYMFPAPEYEANSLAIDAIGNVCVTGGAGSGWWGRGSTFDYATVKYDADGQVAWARLYGSEDGWDIAASVAVDPNGNLFVTGESDGSETGRDFVTIKYTPDGNTHWVQRYDGPVSGWDAGKSVIVDTHGNVIVTGSSEGSGTGLDYATVKYSASGDILWERRYDGPGHLEDEAISLAVDAGGSVYVVGRSTGSGGDFDIATVKYRANGDVEWIARYDAAEDLDRPFSDHDYPCAIEVHSAGDVYVAGFSEWGPMGVSVFTLVKYSQVATQIVQDLQRAPAFLVLDQNYPNPFNPSTTIRYGLPSRSHVTLSVYNTLGQQVATLVQGEQEAGYHEAVFDASGLASSVYLYRLQAGDFIQTRKLVLLK